MPQKMIYVAEADAPILERAQQLAGGNLSAAIARALRLYVETEEARRADLREVMVAVGSDDELQRKQFRGRLLARHREHTPEDELVVQIVYQTAKGKFAVYTKRIARWSSYSRADWEGWDWSTRDYHLDVYETLDALQSHVSKSLFVAVQRKLREDASAVDVLDI